MDLTAHLTTPDDNLVENCENYDIEASKTTFRGICEKCTDGFYKKTFWGPFNTCEPIDAVREPNCTDYQEGVGCTKCAEFHSLAKILRN